MNPTTLSLIIPCYNVQDYVQAALQSVWDNLSEENRQRVQWIMVNDSARDNTSAVIESFIAQHLLAKNVPHQYITQQNSGLSAARNTGLAHATGDYVAFLQHIQRYRAQTKARFGVDFGWCVGYFLGSLWRRWRKKFV